MHELLSVHHVYIHACHSSEQLVDYIFGSTNCYCYTAFHVAWCFCNFAIQLNLRIYKNQDLLFLIVSVYYNSKQWCSRVQQVWDQVVRVRVSILHGPSLSLQGPSPSPWTFCDEVVRVKSWFYMAPVKVHRVQVPAHGLSVMKSLGSSLDSTWPQPKSTGSKSQSTDFQFRSE